MQRPRLGRPLCQIDQPTKLAGQIPYKQHLSQGSGFFVATVRKQLKKLKSTFVARNNRCKRGVYASDLCPNLPQPVTRAQNQVC